MKSFVAGETDAGTRLDIFVNAKVGYSRSFAKQLIETDKVKVRGEVEKPSYRLKLKDKVNVAFDPKSFKVPKIDITVLYEDEDCVVIDKLAGLLTHSKGAFNPEATVATWLTEHVNKTSKNIKSRFTRWHPVNNRDGIVHRLDRGTSGVMIVAKTPEALSWLQKQFSTRKVKKVYIAIIAGELEPKEAIIDMPIERNPKKPQTFRAATNGKPAVTAYKVIKSSDSYSMVELKPTTGRTHQLRVHLKQLGYPIVGDTVYNGKPAERLFLHAKELEITLPSKERRVFRSKEPDVFIKKLKETK